LFVLICGEDSGKRDELWDNLSFVINSMQGQSSISYRAFQFLFPLIACAPPYQVFYAKPYRRNEAMATSDYCAASVSGLADIAVDKLDFG